jgi:hypothetical protein
MIPPLKKGGRPYKNTLSKNGRKIGRPRKYHNADTIKAAITEAEKKPKRIAPQAKPAGHQSHNTVSGTHKKGRQPKNGPVITRAMQSSIASDWLDHVPQINIAAKHGVSPQAISYHIKTHILPMWREHIISGAVAMQARLQHVGAIGFRRWKADPTDAVGAQMCRWATEQEIRLLDLQPPQRLEINAYRVAGKTAQEIEESMVQRLAKQMELLRSRPAITVDADDYQNLEDE